MQLELKKHDFNKLEAETNHEIKILNQTLQEVDERKARLYKESKLMQGSVMDEENKKLDDSTYSQLEILVKELYQQCLNDKGDNKMGNASVLQYLNEIEKKVDHYLHEFIVAEDIDQKIVEFETGEIKKEQRKANRAKVLEGERLANEEKQRKRQAEKEGRNFVKSGKNIMSRSNKPAVHRVKEVTKELTEEEKDRKKYLQMQ